MPITVAQLKKQLKDGKLNRVYLFYGEEQFLQETYLSQLKSVVVDKTFADFNYNLFSENTASFDDFVTAVESYPQMAEKKMIVLKNTDFLRLEDYKKAMVKIISNAPDYAVIVFIESDFKKVKNDLIKQIENIGVIVEFTKQTTSDLRAWVNKKFADSGKKMRVDDMEHLVNICERSLGKLGIECDKLIASVGDNEVIDRSDIDSMVQVPLEYKIFGMADKLLANDANGAYAMLNELKNNKEQPTVVITLIYSQLAGLLMFKQLRNERANAEDFLPYNRKFLARRFASECMRHDEQKLRKAMKLCAEFDEGIKIGKIEGWTALEIIMGNLLTKSIQ